MTIVIGPAAREVRQFVVLSMSPSRFKPSLRRVMCGIRQAMCIVAAGLAVVVGGACAGERSDGAAPAGSSPTRESHSGVSSSTSTTNESVSRLEADIAEAYEAASSAFIDAAAIPDPEFPALASTHAGPMFEQRRETLRALKLDGRVIRYPAASRYRIEVESLVVNGGVARLTVCVVDDGERVNLATGEVIASGTTTVRWLVAMRLVDGSWRLAERREESRWDGVTGCAGD
jgi:hypothetical protein